MQKLNVFISYAHEDEAFKKALDKHLIMLKRSDKIETWSDSRILAGTTFDTEIKQRLNEAHIILLLVSSDFLASEYIWDVELKRAMERHERGEAKVVPIFIKECIWEGAPFGGIKGLPYDAKPVERANNDKVWVEIAQGLKALIEHLSTIGLKSNENNSSENRIKNATSKEALFTQGHALLIGIQYQHWSRGRLPCTLNDVDALHDILTNPNKAAYPVDQVVKLTEAAAKRTDILQAMDTLAQQVQKDATVVVYYSGHGGVKDGRFFFVPYDFALPLKLDGSPDWENAVVLDAAEFRSKLKAIQDKTKKVLVVLDCCHAAGIDLMKELPGEKTFLEGIFDELQSIPAKQLDTNALAAGEGLVILSSSKPGETSLAGNPLSLFTQVLKEALEGQSKKSNDDGWVYIEDVTRYLNDHVPTRANPHPQHPVTDMRGVSGHFRVCAYDVKVVKAAKQVVVTPPKPEPIAKMDEKTATGYRQLIEACQKEIVDREREKIYREQRGDFALVTACEERIEELRKKIAEFKIILEA